MTTITLDLDDYLTLVALAAQANGAQARDENKTLIREITKRAATKKETA